MKENKDLLEKIESLRAKVDGLEKESSTDSPLWDLSKIIFGIIILICLYPFFRLGWFLISLNF